MGEERDGLLPGEARDAKAEEHPASVDEVNLVHYLVLLYRRRRLILGISLGSALLVGFLSVFVWDEYYESTATVLVPQEGTGDVASAMALSGMVQSFYGLSVPSLTPRLDLFENVLKSRRLVERVVRKHGLVEHYGVEHSAEAIERLRRHTRIVAAKEGVISVEVEAIGPELAARLANSYVAELDDILGRFKTDDAGIQSKFIAGQIDKTRLELELAENALVEFKQQNKLISVDEQARGSAESIRDLRMEIGRLEAQLEAWRMELPATNPGLKRLTHLVVEKRRQLGELAYGEDLGVIRQKENPDGVVEEIYVPIADFPHLGLELARLRREVLMKEGVYGLLLTELEKARITESRELPEVRQLDLASPPLQKSRPRTLINVAITGVTGFLLAVIIVLSCEMLSRLRPRFQDELTATAATAGLVAVVERSAPDDAGSAQLSRPAPPERESVT